ncbi:hypothetical protein DUT90_01130 [Polaribacter sp. WD7]|uniref:hypothetical protein n=1 Tax=Polaribacter sp. WD7 TaxID=2269061 RepID=UPI000DF12C6E|nr:hypothetical protein [Polaribacter sp. WD7]RCS28215.1 hypothetical protein DUT90_01130 [Polaribacter sp. WD7]
MEVNIQKAKIDLIQWLTTIEDSSVIQKIMELRNTENKDWWNEISDIEKKSIELGISDADNGNLKPHSEAKKIYEKWL